jgi:hypothetical protein
MADNNPPKRKSGRPKLDPNRPRTEWRKTTVQLTPQQDLWLSEQGEIARQIRLMIDYMREHPEVYQQLIQTS